MAKGAAAGSIARQIRTLWAAGAIGEADDSALLALFRERGDEPEAGDAAFRILVERHGPMVVRVCRRVLGDDHDGLDAAQAVFLVLARKAGSIRRGGTIAPWLHAVACRVAARQKRRLATRRRQESRAAAQRPQAVAIEAPSVAWEAIHDEVARLPEKYRAPVVLCYLEGRTYEETARRLGCPVGTVRVRLSRARDRLRGRLERRGFGPTALFPLATPDPSPPLWVEATVRGARLFLSGQAAGAGTVSASTLALSQGVLWSMTLTKLKFAACGAIVAAGVLATGGSALVGQEKKAATDSNQGQAVGKAADPAPEIDGKREAALRNMLAASRRVQEDKAKLFFGGGIKLSAYLDACREVAEAERLLARTRAERIAAARANLDRIDKVVELVKGMVEHAAAPRADLSELQAARARAELAVIDAEADADAKADDPLPNGTEPRVTRYKEAVKKFVDADREREVAQRLLKSARERLEAQQAFYKEGRITIDRFVDASRRVMEAERRLARNSPERVAAAKAHLDRVSEILKREQAELKIGRGTDADVAEAIQARDQAELDVIDAEAVTDVKVAEPTPDPAPDRDREREIAQRLLKSARDRLELQQALYRNGRNTLDRFLDASRQLKEAETRVATSRAGRVAAAKGHLERLSGIVEIAQARKEQARGTEADVAEARQAREQAELDLLDAERSGSRDDYEALERRLQAVEQKLDRAIETIDLMAPGRGDLLQKVRRAR